MTYNYRQGAVVTFTREDGGAGPGESLTLKASDGWKIEIQDEGCVEITGYGRADKPPSRVVPFHRIWEITTIS